MLLIEGDRRQARYLREGLAVASGLSVDTAPCADDGLHLAKACRYDLVILGTRLPDRSSLDLLDSLRRLGDMPVFMLSGRDDVEERVRGLRGGADDCLAVPFAFSEFLARVQALLRRSRTAGRGADQTLKLADLELDPARRRASRSGRLMALTAQEFSLLLLLMRRQGEVLTRHELAEHLWGISFDRDTNVIEVAVRRLRLKLDQPPGEKLLHTVRGMGYVLEQLSAPVAGAARVRSS